MGSPEEPQATGSDRSRSARDAFTGHTAWARNLAAPVRDFLTQETGGAVVLLAAAAAALVWANSPWSDSYESFWTTKLSVTLGSDVAKWSAGAPRPWRGALAGARHGLTSAASHGAVASVGLPQ